MTKEGYRHLEHGFEPVFDTSSRILVLGSFPSVKSRETGFYYGHPQNRFWRVLSLVSGEREPQTFNEKRALLIRHNIALWDVIASCDISGSGDSTIRNVKPNAIGDILAAAPIFRVAANGAKAYELYLRYCPTLSLELVKLPSTSPANARFGLEILCEEWSRALRL